MRPKLTAKCTSYYVTNPKLAICFGLAVALLQAVDGGGAVKSIAGKIGIIDDIAYQTNLLTLNAAIEFVQLKISMKESKQCLRI